MLEPLDPALPLGRRALASVARTRALGLHFFGHFLGITAVSNQHGRSVLALDPAHDSGGGVASTPTEFATLADLALGSAIRSALGPGLRLGTTSLTLNHFASPVAGRLEADAIMTWCDRDSLESHGRAHLTDRAGTRVATADGWFLALPAPKGAALPPVPWESEGRLPDHTLSMADLDPRERASYDAVLMAEPTALERGVPIAHQLVHGGKPSLDENLVTCELEVSAALNNRVGQMQGGALYGAAAAAATTAAGDDWQLGSGYVQYLRPVDPGRVTLQARVVRRGRRVVFSDVLMKTRGREVLVGRFTHRPRCWPHDR